MGFVDGFRLGKDLWDPSHRFETSWLLPPYVLFACRALFSLYIFTTRFFIIGWDCANPGVTYGGCTAAGNDFSYFTVLTYWGLAFYFLFAAVHTFTYARRGAPLLDRFPRPLQALHAFFYTTVVTFPFLVSIVYWAVLYKGPWFKVSYFAWTNISQHAMNSAFALFEILIPRVSPADMPWVHMLWLIVVLALYLALAYVTQATKGFYTYNFLNPASNGSGTVAGYVFGIAVATLIIYLVAKGLVWLRTWVTERKLGMDGKFSKRPSYDDVGAEMGTFTRNGKADHSGRATLD